MAKKKTQDDDEVQFSVRMPRSLAERLDRTAKALGHKRPGLIRMICIEQLRIYEARVRDGEPLQQEEAG